MNLNHKLERVLEGTGLLINKRAEQLKRETVKELRKVKPRACIDNLGQEGQSALSAKLSVLISECVDQLESLENNSTDLKPREMVDLSQLVQKKISEL